MFKISKITLAAAIMLTSAACHKTEEPISGGGPVEGERVEMTFGFTTSDMSRPTTSIPLEPTENSGSEAAANAVAKNAAALSEQSDLSMTVTMDDAVTRAEEAGTDEENKINNIWVLQFDGTDGASKLVTRDYYSTVVDNALSVSLIGYDGNIRAYFVANVGEDYFNSLSTGGTTLADFEAMDFDFAPTSTVPAGGLPMVGTFEGSTTSGNSVTLTRMVSKIVFNCNVALVYDTDKFAVSSVQLVSASAVSAFSAPEVPTGTTGLYPNSSQPDNFVNSTLEEETKSSFNRTWYVAENLRGVVASLEASDKGEENAPACSSYIEVTGFYTNTDGTHWVAYRIYPGKNATDDFNIERNYIYNLTSNIKGMNETDLRVEVRRGEDISIEGTANCYMVHEADKAYKFNATVMGNGATTAQFVNSKKGNTSPAITPKVLAPVSAKVLWETGTKGSIIASVSLNDGYVFFNTADGSSVAEGNAVIGVFDSSNNLLWSWHIWSTKYNPDSDYATLTNYQKKTYYSMKYNLGANAGGNYDDVPESYGLFYQWGRKDPFIGPKEYNSTGSEEEKFADTTPYDSNYDWKNMEMSSAGSKPEDVIAYSVKNPTHFITSSGSNVSDWVATDKANQLDNLWGNPNAIDGTNTVGGSKSIYDPCPPGWRVPPQDTWTGFTTTGTQESASSANINDYANFTTGYGYHFYVGGSKTGETSFFPAAGLRSYSDGALGNASSYGYYWSSSPFSSSSHHASFLSFYSSKVCPLDSSSRAFSFSVRCIKEIPQILPPDDAINLSAEGTANSYIVNKPATVYGFNATVKGNGAYTPEFVNSDKGNTSPAFGGGIDSKLTPVSASVLWETGAKGSVIADGSVSVQDGCVVFTTAAGSAGAVAEGNALIGVFDAGGTLLWSWHIWSTKYNPDSDYATLVNSSNKTYYSMKYNIGANASKGYNAVPESYGLYYQWGRKDPFIGSADVDGTDKVETSNFSGYEWDFSTYTAGHSSVVSDPVDYAVKHPTHFIGGVESLYDWVAATDIKKQRDNLWGNPNATVGTNTVGGSKSIYDPCPPGWRVPPQDTWTGFTSDGQNAGSTSSSKWNVYGTFTNGWSFYVDTSKSDYSFFPAAGLRDGSDGAFISVSKNGYYWSSSPISGSYGYLVGRLYFNSDNVYPLDNNYRVTGFSIRCVKE